MRTADRALALLAVLIGAPAASAHAADLGALLDRILGQNPSTSVREQSQTPRAILPAGANGPSIDLREIGNPVQLEQKLRNLLRTPAAELRLNFPKGEARLGDFSVGASQVIPGDLLVLEGELELSGRVAGNVVVLDGDIVLHPGAQVSGDALVLGGRIRDRGGIIQGERRGLSSAAAASTTTRGALAQGLTRAAGLAGLFFTLAVVGFGMVLFGQPQLETISDTVTSSLFRSLLTGLLAQVLVLPTLGMVITGLVLSVVGILLVPFVLIVVPLLVIAAIVGGFLAVAHAIGERRIRRRMATGAQVGSANSYRYLLLGLSSIAAAWAAWILFGWVPLAGTLIAAAALLASWLLATIGFGAALLSRGGIRPAFAGRYVPPEALTDEYLWATPQFGVNAVTRPKGSAVRGPGSKGRPS